MTEKLTARFGLIIRACAYAGACWVLSSIILEIMHYWTLATRGYGAWLPYMFPILNLVPIAIVGMLGVSRSKPELLVAVLVFFAASFVFSLVSRIQTKISFEKTYAVDMDALPTFENGALTTAAIPFRPQIADARLLSNGVIESRNFITFRSASREGADDRDLSDRIEKITSYTLKPIAECTLDEHELSIRFYAAGVLDNHCIEENLIDAIPDGVVLITGSLLKGEKRHWVREYKNGEPGAWQQFLGKYGPILVRPYVPHYDPIRSIPQSRPDRIKHFNNVYSWGAAGPLQPIQMKSSIHNHEALIKAVVPAYGVPTEMTFTNLEEFLKVPNKYAPYLAEAPALKRRLYAKFSLVMLEKGLEGDPVDDTAVTFIADTIDDGQAAYLSENRTLFNRFFHKLASEQRADFAHRLMTRIEMGDVSDDVKFNFVSWLPRYSDHEVTERALQLFDTVEHPSYGVYTALLEIAASSADKKSISHEVFDIVLRKGIADRFNQLIAALSLFRADDVDQLKAILCETNSLSKRQIDKVESRVRKSIRKREELKEFFGSSDQVNPYAYRRVCGVEYDGPAQNRREEN
ncbi:MAG: hypothetical protein AAF224_13155 [Pseudomonadota bacterium]